MTLALQFFFQVFIICFLLGFVTQAQGEPEKIVAGWVEKIILAPQQLKLRAKLDTGAKTSSIHAVDVKTFERNEQPWVRFTLPAVDVEDAKPHQVEAEVVRTVLIKRHKLDSMRRIVVELDFCMDGGYYRSEFTLANRTNYNYPVLLGRRFLENHIIVDPSEKFLHSKKLKGLKCHKAENS